MKAFLQFMQITQQYGAEISQSVELTAEIRATVPGLLQDPQTAAFYAAQNLAGDPRMTGDRQSAGRYLATSSGLDKLPFGTFRYVTYANLVQNSQNTKSWDTSFTKLMPPELADNYWIHLAAYPWAANGYIDLGNYYLKHFPEHGAMSLAWCAFDYGRVIDPAGWPALGVGITRMEQHMRSDAPDFF